MLPRRTCVSPWRMEPTKHSDNTAMTYFMMIPVVHVIIWVVTVYLGTKVW